MKRFLLLFGFLFAVISGIRSQQLREGFEGQAFPPFGWKAFLVEGEHGWAIRHNMFLTGKSSAYSQEEDPNSDFFGRGDKWLTSPKIVDIESGDKVSFYLATEHPGMQDPPDFYDSLYVYMSTTGNDLSDFSDPPVGEYFLENLTDVFSKFEVNIPASFVGQDIYVALRHVQVSGDGFYLDEFSAGSKKTNDALIQEVNLSDDAVFVSNSSTALSATIFNNGTGTIPSGIQVSYTIDGAAGGTASTSSSIASGATGVVNFASLTIPSAGVHQLEFSVNWSADEVSSNDEFVYQLISQQPKTNFPYFEDFSNPDGWTISGEGDWQNVDEVITQFSPLGEAVVNPSNLEGFSYLASTQDPNKGNLTFTLRSPLLDFTGVQKPMLNFYVASASLEAINVGGASPDKYLYNDSLSILISTDGGVSYHPAPLYAKSGLTTPELRTEEDDFNDTYVPENGDEWRLEIVDLSDYKNLSNVMVAIQVIGGFGNNVYIDNVTISDQDPSLYKEEEIVNNNDEVTGGPFNTGIHFSSVPVEDWVRIEGHNTMTGSLVQPENNTTSKAPDETIFTPDIVDDHFITAAYSGNTIPGQRAAFKVTFDLTQYSVIPEDKRGKVYIMWRADQDDKWKALNTSFTDATEEVVITSDVQNRFGDFAIAYPSAVVPVTLISFTGRALKQTVQLDWETAQEENISMYQIQRLDGDSWKIIGNVQSNRTSLENRYSFVDMNPVSGINLYRLRIIDVTGSEQFSDIVKVKFDGNDVKVYQNMPNPVRSYTIIRYQLQKDAHVQIGIFDANGRQVEILENASRKAGTYDVRWNAGKVPAGNYFYRVVIGNKTFTTGMLKL